MTARAYVYDEDGLVDFEASFSEEEKTWLHVPYHLPPPKPFVSLRESEAFLEHEFWREYSEEDQTWLYVPPASSPPYVPQAQRLEVAARTDKTHDSSSSSSGGSVLSAVSSTGESTPTRSSASSDRSTSNLKVVSGKVAMRGRADAQDIKLSTPVADKPSQGQTAVVCKNQSRPEVHVSLKVPVTENSMRPLSVAQRSLQSHNSAKWPVNPAAADGKQVQPSNAAEKSGKIASQPVKSVGVVPKKSTAAVDAFVKPVKLHDSLLETAKSDNAVKKPGKTLAVAEKSVESSTPPDSHMKQIPAADKSPAVSCDGSTTKGARGRTRSVQAAAKATLASGAAVTPPTGEDALRRLASSASRIPRPSSSRQAAMVPMSVPVKARATSVAHKEEVTARITAPHAAAEASVLRFGFGKSTKVAYQEWQSAVSRKNGHL